MFCRTNQHGVFQQPDVQCHILPYHSRLRKAFQEHQITDSDNNATVPQVVPVTSGGTIYYLNPSSGPNLVGGAMPINVSSAALTTVGGPEVVPTEFIATARTERTAFTAQDLAQLLASC